MTTEEWNKVNNLLASLRTCHVVHLVRTFYKRLYGTSAPAEVLKGQMDEVQQLLDRADKEQNPPRERYGTSDTQLKPQ